jgi:hypothetical protein
VGEFVIPIAAAHIPRRGQDSRSHPEPEFLVKEAHSAGCNYCEGERPQRKNRGLWRIRARPAASAAVKTTSLGFELRRCGSPAWIRTTTRLTCL